MDPDACVRRINSALGCGDYDEAKAACADLADWLDKGGFPPSVPLDIRAQVWALRRVAGDVGMDAYVREECFRAGFRAAEDALGGFVHVEAESKALAAFIRTGRGEGGT